MGISTAPAVGARGSVRIGEETVHGRVVQPTHQLEFTSESLTASENVIESEGIKEDRGRHKLIRGNLEVGGDFNFEQAASGFGMMLRHALGDYARLPGADGGIRGRLAGVPEAYADVDAGSVHLIEFTQEQSGRFANAAQTFALVYRDANNVLVTATNSDAGYAFTSYSGREETYVISVDDNNTDHTTAAAVEVTVADVVDADGNLVPPDFSTSGGVIYFGANRTRAVYTEYVPGTGGSNDSVLILSADTSTPQGGSANGPNPVANDVCIGAPGLAHTSAWTLPAAADLGAFAYEFDDDWLLGDEIPYTHHIERGRKLPVGLTIEVNRDAAIFIYSGMKTASLTLTFDANAIVTGTVTYSGKQEFGPTTLLNDVVPGTTTIQIANRTTFPHSGMLTIGEETEITYTAIARNVTNPEIWDVTITDNTQIERLHLSGQNVDSRRTTEANIIEFDYDAQSANFTVGSVLTFSGAGTAEVLLLEDAGGTGTVVARMLSGTVPVDNETFTSNDTVSGDGTVNGTPVRLSPFVGNSSPLTSFETMVYFSGGYEEVMAGSITLNNNINSDKYGLGSRFPFQVVEEQAVVEASVTLEFDDGKHYRKFTEAEFFSLEFKAISESDDSLIGNTGVLSGAYYFLPKCKYTGTTPVIESTSFIQHDMPVTAVVDDENKTTDLVIVLVNKNPHDVSVTGL